MADSNIHAILERTTVNTTYCDTTSIAGIVQTGNQHLGDNMENMKAVNTESAVAEQQVNFLLTGSAREKVRYNKRQGGFGLIEIMIVSIILLLTMLYAIMSRSDTAFSSSDSSNELGHVSSLITGTKQLKTTSGYGVSIDLTSTLYASGAIPAIMTYSASKIYNTWNGKVTIASNATGMAFTVKYESVPQDACISLATKAASYSYSTTINANTAIVGEVTAATATTQCNSALANSLTWTVNG